MGILAPRPGAPRLEDDPKAQPGAYINLGTQLYYVLGLEAGRVGQVHCENCRTGYPVWLTATNIDRATLIKPAPKIELPDSLPDEGS